MKAQPCKPPYRARWPAGLAAIVAATLLFSGTARGNNLVIENVTLTGFNDTEHYALIQFDIRWDNSWRLDVAPGNYDAAWIFAKFRWADGVWRIPALNLTGHSSGTCNVPGVLEVPDDAQGAFLSRASVGTGDFACTGVQLRLNYGENGFLDDEGGMEVAVFGIEMVYIPEGAFYLGSGGTESGHFYTFPDTATPYLVTSEAAINVGATDGFLFYDEYGDQTGPIPDSYPKGYAAFYVMKYEVTQQQWAGFLNMIPPSAASGLRGGMIDDGGDPPTYTANVPDRVNGYVRHDFALAYADWAALRLPSELEWEKAARGPLAPVPNEYAWGGTAVHGSFYAYANENTPDEIVAEPPTLVGNAHYRLTKGSRDTPLRAGIFAASFPNASHPDPPSRMQSGASYYGVMEMSGSLSEWTIGVGNEAGRDYTGAHGDGELANPWSWYYWDSPLAAARTTRGGAFRFDSYRLPISRRNPPYGSSLPIVTDGFRAARAAP